MSCNAIESDRVLCVWKPLNPVTGLRVVLTIPAWRKIPGRHIVYEGIVEDLREFVAQGSNVAESWIVET